MKPIYSRIVSTLCAVLLPSMSCANDVVADPTSPPLVPAFCAAGLPPITNDIWSGELIPWAGVTRPMVKVVLGGNAVCNDGSQAVIYVRPAPANLPNGAPNPLVNMYHIHFKGGGSCRSFAECQKRFCRSDPMPKHLDRPGLMSSLGYVNKIEGTGMFSQAPANRIAMSNQVLAAYCSSDNWIGSAPAGTAHSIDATDDPAAVSSIAFMGEEIVNQMLIALDAGITRPVPVINQTYVLPPLTMTQNLLITGDSGGASGARYHLDRISNRYPNATTVAALDAGASIDMQDPRIDYTSMLATPTYDDMMYARAKQERFFHGVDDSALDASCKAANPGFTANDSVCFDSYRTQRDYITTPTIQRTSQADSTAVTRLQPMLLPPTGATLRQLSYDGMAASTAARANLSGLSPNCTQHVTFRNNNQFSNMRVTTFGPRLSQEIQDWTFSCFAGGCPKIVRLANPTVAGSSSCP